MDYCLLPLSRGLSAIVDPEDYEWAKEFKWSAGTPIPYPFRMVRSNGKEIAIRLHREIMLPSSNYVVDHINGDPLDNRRSNLRLVTHQQNIRNRGGPQANSSTGLLGVSRKRSKWRAYINVDGKQINLGVFDTPEAASEARKEAEITYFGELSAAHR